MGCGRRRWNSRVRWKKLKILTAGENWHLNCFFLSFSSHENYSTKDILVHRKSNIGIKVTNTQNLEHFKMINRRLFIHKFCSNSKILCCHPPGQYLLIRTLVFSFLFALASVFRWFLMLVLVLFFFTVRLASWRAEFTLFRWDLNMRLVTLSSNTFWRLSKNCVSLLTSGSLQMFWRDEIMLGLALLFIIILYFLFWHNKSQPRSFLMQLETIMRWLREYERKIICDDNV